MVIPYHMMFIIPVQMLKDFGKYGWAGVDLFFVLSGFLIGSQLFRMLKFDGSISFSRFYVSRAFRIFPSFWVVLALYVV
jgi:peptidoglycan/LPS O-acetylase OafA/YrhL